ncbi:hypothetical protein R1flu_000501 [Riccia fluitans]|uniref:Uncharacterized protein n=1 Tax=Riccia fluitans TaxID=41844 RepID=A0ABD1Y0Z6_9MARC
MNAWKQEGAETNSENRDKREVRTLHAWRGMNWHDHQQKHWKVQRNVGRTTDSRRGGNDERRSSGQDSGAGDGERNQK